MRPRRATLALSAVIASGCLAPAAHAASVYGYEEYDIRDEYIGIDIVDRAGERNDIAITVGRRVEVRERGHGSLRAIGNCRRASARLVTCPKVDAEYGNLHVSLGDGDDTAHVGGKDFYDVKVYGGDGDDRLTAVEPAAELFGGAGRDKLVGSPRGDALYGGPDRDRLYGRTGNDLLSGDGFGPRHLASRSADLLDGGHGHDEATWDGRTSEVTADLAAGSGGARGERDTLRSIENASGGSRRDRLLGNGAANALIGNAGADVMLGGRGDDEIDGGLRRLGYYGSGPDRSRDTIDCGPGRDLVRHVGYHFPQAGERADPIPQDCERMTVDGVKLPVPRLRIGATRLRVTFDCEDVYGTCTRRAVLKSNGMELGHTETRTTNENRFELTVDLRRPLATGPPIAVELRGSDDESGYPSRRFGFRYLLIRPRG